MNYEPNHSIFGRLEAIVGFEKLQELGFVELLGAQNHWYFEMRNTFAAVGVEPQSPRGFAHQIAVKRQVRLAGVAQDQRVLRPEIAGNCFDRFQVLAKNVPREQNGRLVCTRQKNVAAKKVLDMWAAAIQRSGKKRNLPNNFLSTFGAAFVKRRPSILLKKKLPFWACFGPHSYLTFLSLLSSVTTQSWYR